MEIAITLDKDTLFHAPSACVREVNFIKQPTAIPQDDGIVIAVEAQREDVPFKLNIHLTKKDLVDLIKRTNTRRGTAEQDEYDKYLNGEIRI